MISWTDERVDLLKKLWGEGLSASQIAGELGGVTRNAVIGKVHRLGLSGRAKAPQPAANRPKKPTTRPATSSGRSEGGPISLGATALKAETLPSARPQAQPTPQLASLSDEPLIPNASVLQINEQTCKWPVGDPSSPDFHFCARRSDVGIPYCAYHARIAYQPVADRRRDRDRRALRA
ncbi:MAG: GcrA cell cycle regulator [Hyphomicrobiales bacterium]|nr:GcrA cell cycle regulator [Hyphomicrobiales bacterium]